MSVRGRFRCRVGALSLRPMPVSWPARSNGNPTGRWRCPRAPDGHRAFSSSLQPSHAFLSSEPAGPSTVVSQLADYFLSQPLAPLSYTLSTVLLTLLVRTTTTLPASLWARRRISRFESIVLPRFRAFRSGLAQRAKRSFLHPAEIRVYQAHLQHSLKAELDRLLSVHRCRPAVTIAGSLAVHVPVIYTLTSVLRDACARTPPGTPLALEPSLTTASLLEPDLALALACWAAFLANVELNGAVRQARRAASEPSRSAGQPTSFVGRGLAFWTPEKIRTASFVAGIGMMGISCAQPSLVLVYWLTSNSFSIAQSLVFIYLDQKSPSQQPSLDNTNPPKPLAKQPKSALNQLPPIK